MRSNRSPGRLGHDNRARKLGQEKSDEWRSYEHRFCHMKAPSWLSLQDAHVIRRNIQPSPEVATCRIALICEDLSPGWESPCSLEDVEYLLPHTPPDALGHLQAVVLHQPTRKELSFGRYFGWAICDFAFRNIRGHAVFLNAVPSEPKNVWHYSKNSSPAQLADLNNFRHLGIPIIETQEEYEVNFPRSLYREWVLYRVLPHELGHIRQEWPLARNCEADAERYAIDLSREWKSAGVIPFAPMPLKNDA